MVYFKSLPQLLFGKSNESNEVSVRIKNNRPKFEIGVFRLHPINVTAWLLLIFRTWGVSDSIFGGVHLNIYGGFTHFLQVYSGAVHLPSTVFTVHLSQSSATLETDKDDRKHGRYITPESSKLVTCVLYVSYRCWNLDCRNID